MLVNTRPASGQDSAQVYQPSNTNASSHRTFNVKGEVGTFGELYGISGHERRRPGSTGRLFLRST
ncbi:hypothetical protein C3F09_09095, partial [candidate division GN15 bacterium]